MRLTLHQKRATERWTRSKADEMAVANGCWFNLAAATRVCQFFEKFLKHSKGEWAGEPFKLLKWQAEDVIKPLFGWMRADGTRRYRTAYIEIPKKNGKALALDTPIPTPKGWRTMGELTVGDEVFDERGNPCHVVATSEIMLNRPCYAVNFSDGERIIADAEHLWATHTRKPEDGRRIWTTQQIASTLFWGKSKIGGRNHSIPLAAPLQLPDQELPIPPYPSRQARSKTRQITAVEQVPSVPVKCIQVNAPSHLYLAGCSMVPTHNSTMASGLALYMLIADDEPGSEVYSAAATRDQASIVYKEAANMVKASTSLDSRLTRVDSLKHMADERTNSWYKALSADAGSNEGLNIHCLIMDEMHAQRDDKFWNALMYGGAARRQPLQVIITTAGVDQDSLCYEYHTKAMQIQEGTIQDDSFFAYVRSAEWAILRAKPEDKEACWKDETVWHEANPSLGHTISLESFREDFQKAIQSPRLENAFKRYRLNIWTQQEERWLPMDHWAVCGTALSEEELEGQPCFGGLDLASTSDFCAFVLWFPSCGNAILPFFWIPQETVDEMERKGDPTYVPWVRQGFLRTTEGNVADYDVIREDIKELAGRFDIQKIAVDRWNAAQIITQLQGDGFEMVAWGQGYASMSSPSKELERLIIGHGLRHGQHPVLTWCVGNVAAQKDAAGNLKPSKALSKKKIDGVVALIEAIGVAALEPKEEESVYNSRGILIL